MPALSDAGRRQGHGYLAQAMRDTGRGRLRAQAWIIPRSRPSRKALISFARIVAFSPGPRFPCPGYFDPTAIGFSSSADLASHRQGSINFRIAGAGIAPA